MLERKTLDDTKHASVTSLKKKMGLSHLSSPRKENQVTELRFFSIKS